MKYFFIAWLFCTAVVQLTAQTLPSRPNGNILRQPEGIYQPVQQKFAANTINGSISLYDNIYNEMVQANGGQKPEGSVIKVELYNYLYTKDKTNTFNTKMYLTNKEDVQVSYTKAANAITFTCTNVPTGKYAVVVSFFAAAPQYKAVIITDKCEQDNRFLNASTVRCNAKLRIPGIISFGVNTVNTSTAGQVNFTTSFISNDGSMNVSLIGDIGDFISDAVDLVGDALADAAGVVVNAAGAIIMTVGTTVITFVQSGELPKFRIIGQGEYDWANGPFFNGTLPSKNSIILSNLMSIKRRQYTIPTGTGHILVNLGYAFSNPMRFTNEAYTFPGRLFIHELTHAWQIEHNALLKAFAEGVSNQWEYTVMGNKDIYKPNEQADWNGNNFEQQAAIADICYYNIFQSAPKRCTWAEAMIAQHVRNNTPFPFTANSVKETALQESGSKTVYGKIEWSKFNLSYPENVNPSDVFEITVLAPAKKIDVINNCDGNNIRSDYGPLHQLKPAIAIDQPQSGISQTNSSISVEKYCTFRIDHLPEGIPVYISVKSIADWQPGLNTLNQKPANGKFSFNTWIEKEGPVLVTSYDGTTFSIKGAYGPVAPDKAITNGIKIKPMQSDAAIGQAGIEQQGVIKQINRKPINSLPARQRLSAQQKF
jgi:hypothetical protein